MKRGENRHSMLLGKAEGKAGEGVETRSLEELEEDFLRESQRCTGAETAC